jgi:hypothetical protein
MSKHEVDIRVARSLKPTNSQRLCIEGCPALEVLINNYSRCCCRWDEVLTSVLRATNGSGLFQLYLQKFECASESSVPLSFLSGVHNMPT